MFLGYIAVKPSAFAPDDKGVEDLAGEVRDRERIADNGASVAGTQNHVKGHEMATTGMFHFSIAGTW